MGRWFGSVALVLALVGSAHADERWTYPYVGVRHLHKRAYQLDVHVVYADLGAASTSVIATRPGDRGITVREFANRYNADIAINANYYDLGIRPCGLTAGDGIVWTDAYHERCSMSLGFGDLNEAEAFESRGILCGPLPQDWMKHVVSGKPWLVRKGVVQGGWNDPGHMHGNHPRTAVGITEDRNTLIMLVADGRRPGLPGIDGQRLATLMADLGAHDAVNLDGGGSSTLFIKGEGGVQNRPSDPLLRDVGNHLGVRIAAGAKWYGAQLEALSKTPLLRPGDMARLWVRYRNTGRFSWHTTGKHAVVLSSTLSQPSPFYVPGWVSTTTPARLEHSVRPGETITFEFQIGAPAMLGNFSLDVAPRMAGIEPMTESAVSWQLPIEDVKAGLPTEIAKETPSTAATKTSALASISTAVHEHLSNWVLWLVVSLAALGTLVASRRLRR